MADSKGGPPLLLDQTEARIANDRTKKFSGPSPPPHPLTYKGLDPALIIVLKMVTTAPWFSYVVIPLTPQLVLLRAKEA